MAKHRVYQMNFAKVYPMLLQKVEKKGKTKAELNKIIKWLLGYDAKSLNKALKDEVDVETFFTSAPKPNPHRELIKGVVCGVRVEEVEEPVMREIRYLDKLVDELARGKKMESILRKPE